MRLFERLQWAACPQLLNAINRLCTGWLPDFYSGALGCILNVMAKDISSFDVLKFMSENKEDIRLAPLSNIIAADKKGQHCTITIGVDEKSFHDYMAGKDFLGGLILADKKRF
jgi:hypothetical protein